MDDTELMLRSGELPSAPQRTGTALAMPGADPFAAYGASAQTGDFLSFKNGEWLFGVDGEMLDLGTRLVANVEGLKRGWRCWKEKKLVEDLTRPLIAMIPPERRSDLGDTDPAMWERDAAGKPMDPYVLTDMIELADPAAGKLFVYATSSKGGTNCIKRLCATYSQHRRQSPGEVPIVSLGRDSYNHPEFKKIYVPMLEVVGWTDAENPSVDGEAEGDDIPFDGPTIPARAAVSAPASKTRF